jgi:hypothetical protein
VLVPSGAKTNIPRTDRRVLEGGINGAVFETTLHETIGIAVQTVSAAELAYYYVATRRAMSEWMLR